MSRALDRRATAPSLWERAAVPLEAASAVSFAALSRVRGKRIFHPSGHAYVGEFRANAEKLTPRHVTGRSMRAFVRISRGAGMPDGVPDVLGFALKLEGVVDRDTDQDFVLASSLPNPALRHVLVPARRYLGVTYSSVLPYRSRDTQILFGAKADPPVPSATSLEKVYELVVAGRVRFALLAAELLASWSGIGVIELTGRCDPAVSEQLRFNPWNTSPELVPAGSLNRLRRNAYLASQAARASAKGNDLASR